MENNLNFFLKTFFLIISLFIIFIIYKLFIHQKIKHLYPSLNKESFTSNSFDSYANCIEEGYPQSFCGKIPIKSYLDLGFCECQDGYFGALNKKTGKCSCFKYKPNDPINYSYSYGGEISKPF